MTCTSVQRVAHFTPCRDRDFLVIFSFWPITSIRQLKPEAKFLPHSFVPDSLRAVSVDLPDDVSAIDEVESRQLSGATVGSSSAWKFFSLRNPPPGLQIVRGLKGF